MRTEVQNFITYTEEFLWRPTSTEENYTSTIKSMWDWNKLNLGRCAKTTTIKLLTPLEP